MSMGTGYGLAAFAIQRVIVDIIGGGVPARYPGLKFVITEWETGWIAHFLQRMDWAFVAHYRTKPAEVTESFSYYWRQNFLGTFEDDRIGLATRYDVGVENLMWGSDFPHHDSTFPRSKQVLDDIFEDIPDDERFLITAGNVRNTSSHTLSHARDTPPRPPVDFASTISDSTARSTSNEPRNREPRGYRQSTNRYAFTGPPASPDP